MHYTLIYFIKTLGPSQMNTYLKNSMLKKTIDCYMNINLTGFFRFWGQAEAILKKNLNAYELHYLLSTYASLLDKHKVRTKAQSLKLFVKLQNYNLR